MIAFKNWEIIWYIWNYISFLYKYEIYYKKKFKVNAIDIY
jgi:hypothetical protein